MKNFIHKILIILVILSSIMLLGLECHWGDKDDDVGDVGDDPADIKTLSTTAIATVDVIYATEMDVITVTDDGVVLTCDLPTSPILVEGNLVKIIIDFESVDDNNWVIIDVQFDQKVL